MVDVTCCSHDEEISHDARHLVLFSR
jgi:hypothetical protein